MASANECAARRPTVLYISHGGGPLPLLGDPHHQELVESLKKLSSTVTKPKSILLISAHWEELHPTLTFGAKPQLIYDYGGFPRESYSIKYPAPGDIPLAEKVFAALNENGLNPRKDAKRGFDHGMFVPLKVMYPEADIPCVQLSLSASLDADEHLKMGEALRSIDLSDVLVVGSGFSFHNMGAFFSQRATDDKKNKDFDNWLRNVVGSDQLSNSERRTELVNWAQAPGARFCHPREEHLLPIHVCYGLAQRQVDEAPAITIIRKKASMFLWHGDN